MTWATDRLDLIKAGTVDVPPVTATLGMGLLDDWGPGWARKSWTPKLELLNGDGSLFGGYLAALADQILAFAAMTVVEDDVHFRTVNLQMQFVKVGRAQPLTIEARVVSVSRQLITVSAEFRRPDGEVIATAQAQQVTTPKVRAFANPGEATA
jgi:uncharacterized protein (TIGR00369 family)